MDSKTKEMGEKSHDRSQSDEDDTYTREIKNIKGRPPLRKYVEKYKESSPVVENPSDDNPPVVRSNEQRQSRSKSADPEKLQHTSSEGQNTSDNPIESVDVSQITDDDNDDETIPIKATKPETPDRQKLFSIRNWAILTAVFVAVIAAIWVYVWPYKPVPKKIHHSCEHFSELEKKYPTFDDMLWSTLIVGVNRTINRNPNEPATFIFLYNSSAVADLFLGDITRITIDCFGTGGAIWRTSNDFKADEIAQNYDRVLSRYREILESQGILVVRDLDRVPPTAAKIFFPICDSYTPLVPRAVIFFTIDISRQPERVVRSNRSCTSIAEGILKDLWRDDLHPNMLDPLVVRLTENVFRID
ncbi:uncharacterized protein LOC134214789 [Armigeres subalbatus]|uniref:uncharacterized protein LOC134214789 n=1 Tax=Armigeres subalbatus TaxID=124917 RepID=UPI002ED0727C